MTLHGFRKESESSYVMWEMYILIIECCTSHNLDDLTHILYFTTGLHGDKRLLLEALARATIITKMFMMLKH